MLAIQYQALKRVDRLGTHNQEGFREPADVMELPRVAGE